MSYLTFMENNIEKLDISFIKKDSYINWYIEDFRIALNVEKQRSQMCVWVKSHLGE